jgi:hypothetical protein
MYKTEDQGLFIGMTTTDYPNLSDFIKNEIEKPFEQYRDNLKKSCTPSDEASKAGIDTYFKNLYKPKVYGVFGSFHLMAISLVDDFTFASRYFHPFNSYLNRNTSDPSEQYEGKNYTFNVISGVCPRLEGNETPQMNLLDKAKLTFLQKENKDLPFVANLSLKVNNALLIGSGGLLIDLMLRKINVILNSNDDSRDQIVSIIYHSFSWNEISILFFSGSFDSILKKIFEIRELSFKELRGNQEAEEVEDLFRYVSKATLLKSMLEEAVLNGEMTLENMDFNIENSHLFVHANTTFGYDINMLDTQSMYDLKLNHEIDLLIKWDIKPGHLKIIQEEISEKLTYSNGNLFSNRTELAFQTGKVGSFEKYFEMLHASTDDKLRKHIRRITSIPTFSNILLSGLGNSFEIDEQFLFHDQLHKFRFSIKDIDRIRDRLKYLRFPMILQDKISKMFVIYNDGIYDPILYGYFIELRWYLQTIYEILEKQESEATDLTTVVDIVDLVTPWIEVFELAYKNRFGQSYIMNEITDFNLEFNGGIQQLIAAYDGAYKSIVSLFGEDDCPRSVVYVAGETNVESDQLSVRLNYLHLYQPEFFAAAATHEAVNYFFERKEYKDKRKNDWTKLIELREEIESKINREPEPDVDADFETSIINYVPSDLFTFYFGFNRDLKLFFFWHWASFIQTGIMYNRNGTINQDLFDVFIARMLMIDIFINHQSEEEFSKFNSHFDAIIPPQTLFCSITQQAWEQGVFNTKEDVVKIYKKYKKYIEAIGAYSKNLMLYEFGIDPSEDFDKLKQHWKRIKDNDSIAAEMIEDAFDKNEFKDFSFNSNMKTDRIKIRLLYAAHYFKNSTSEKIRAIFKVNKVFTLGQEKSDSVVNQFEYKSSFSYHALLLAYLKQVMEMTADKWAFLFRDSKDSKTRINPLDDGLLKLDPFGGIFSSNIIVRKQLFRLRSLFLKSLWDFSTQEKLRYFKKKNEL